MSLRAQEARILLIGVCGWHKNGWKGATQWTHVDNFAERNRPRISNASDRSSVFRLHAKRGNCWSSGSSFRNRLVQEIDDDKGDWRKKTRRKKHIRWKRSPLGATIWKVMPKNALKDSAKKQKKKMYLLPSKWQRLAWTITWYLRKTVRQLETSLQYVLRLFWNALYSASIGRTDFSWSVNTLARPVTKWIKDCDNRLLRLINYVNQTKNFIQFCHVGNQIEDCKLGLFQDASFAGDLRDLKNQRQEVYCTSLDHTRLFQFRGCARSKPQFLTAVQSLIFYPGAGLRVDGSLGLQFVLERLSSKGNFERHMRERVIPSHSHSDIFWINWPRTTQHSQQFRLNPTLPVRRHCGSDSNDQERTKPKPEARHENAQSRSGSGANLDHSIFDQNTCEQQINWRIFWQVESSPHGSGIHCWLRGNSDDRMDQMMFAAFSRKPFSCRTLAKPQGMSQVMTQHESVDQIWSENASKVSKSGCALDGHLALEQLRNCEFLCTQDKRDLLAWCTISRKRRDTSCKLRYCISDLEKTKGLWDNQSFQRRIVEDARGRSSCLLRCCFMYGKTSDERASNQLHQKMEWLSRAIQKICSDNWWRKDPVHIPHASWCQN